MQTTINFASYTSVVDWLFGQLPMYQREGKSAFKKDLTNIISLCDALGNPQNSFKSIHIAGTNGKGSTAHIIASGLQLSGLKVGLYTSPHYIDYRERVKVDGGLMGKSFVKSFVKNNFKTIISIQPSFFEITVAMAFQYFKEQQVDIAVIETGLGGRLDSTNIIKPILSVITNISLDHEAMLGNTLTQIAKEKAGIIKIGCPILIGERQDDIEDIFIEKAKEMSATIYFAEDRMKVALIDNHITKSIYKISSLLVKNSEPKLLSSDLSGPYQYKNIATALSSLELIGDKELLANFVFDWKQLEHLLRDMNKRWLYMGRWQVLGENPLIIGDSAHNKAGIETVVKALTESKMEQLHVVIGFVSDKTLENILGYFPQEATYYFVQAKISRALQVDKLQHVAKSFGLEGKTYSSVRKGLAAAKQKASADDLIYIGGSIFVLAEVL